MVLAVLVLGSFMYYYRKYIYELLKDDQEFLSVNQEEFVELRKMDGNLEHGVLDGGEKKSNVETRGRSMGERDYI